jgi:hypothetical protein
VASGKAAVRNVVLDMMSGVITVNAGSFPAQSLVIGFPTNANSLVDFTYGSFLGSGSGTQPLAGQSTNNVLASLATVGAELVLTLPLNYTTYATGITANDIQLTFTGQFVAKAPAATPLQVSHFQVTPGQLHFSIATVTGHSYTVLGSTNLINWSMINDQFIATATLTTRDITLPSLPGLFFRIRQDN